MTWYQQLQLLHLLQNTLPGKHLLEIPEEPADDDRLRRTFQRIEAATTEAVDAAVRTFSSQGKLPALQGAEAYFLAQRLEFAVWLTMALGAGSSGDARPILPDPPSSLLPAAQVEWLLVWAWRTPGRAYWLEKAILNEKLRRTRQQNPKA